MKKSTAIILCILFALLFASCGKDKKDTQLSFEHTLSGGESGSEAAAQTDALSESDESQTEAASSGEAEPSDDESDVSSGENIANDTEDEDTTNESGTSEGETTEEAVSAADSGEPYVGAVKNGSVSYEDGLYYITDSSTGVKFVVVNKTYPVPKDYAPGGINPDCKAAFDKLVEAAKAEGLNIWSRNDYRSYSLQSQLYSNYSARDGKEAADKYSARPGHSEHQTGYAIDCNSLSTSWGETPEGKWLAANCTDYGFIIRYGADKISSTGYQYEPWHIRYVGSVELAKKLTDSGLSVEEYYGITSQYN